jgi:hypothetical protein
MTLVLPGVSACKLCGKIIEKDDAIAGFPAFLPYDHKFGQFSDAAMHEACFQAYPDCGAVEDMYKAFRMIMDSHPSDLKTLEEVEAWQKEAFKDWPPKNGVVIFEPLFPDENSEGPFWMDADAYRDMCEAEDEHERKQKALREESHRLEREWWHWRRDD